MKFRLVLVPFISDGTDAFEIEFVANAIGSGPDSNTIGGFLLELASSWLMVYDQVC